MPVTSTQTSSYLMTGILAECCNERILSDSIMEKKGGVSGHFKIVHNERKTGLHVQTQHAEHSSSICSISEYSKCINPINPALSH